MEDMRTYIRTIYPQLAIQIEMAADIRMNANMTECQYEYQYFSDARRASGNHDQSNDNHMVCEAYFDGRASFQRECDLKVLQPS